MKNWKDRERLGYSIYTTLLRTKRLELHHSIEIKTIYTMCGNTIYSLCQFVKIGERGVWKWFPYMEFWMLCFCILQIAGSSITASVYLPSSVYPPIHRTPHLRNRTSCDHNFWYTCVKWWYLQVFFFHFDFLGC